MMLPTSMSIQFQNLLSSIEIGKVKIPTFQRDFVWSRKKSASLLDSIVKGYPVGTFIFWTTTETLKSSRNIGGIKFKNIPKGAQIDYVLDGQQRITSIIAALRGEKINRNDNTREDMSKIVVDLDSSVDEEIIKPLADPDRECIPLVKMLNASFDELGKLDEKYQDKITEYIKTISSYAYSVIKIDTSIENATEIFSRMNSSVVELNIFEIMTAMTYDEGKFNLLAKFNELVESVPDEYSNLPKKPILSAMALILKGDCKTRSILGIKSKDIMEIWDRLAYAIIYAANYFRSTYKIPTSDLLPYKALIVPFAYFFYKRNGIPTDFQKQHLDNFFWMVSLSNRYSSAVDTRLAQDIKRIEAILDEQEPSYNWAVDTTIDSIKQRGKFRVNSSYIKAILCIYAHMEPKSFIDNSPVVITSDGLKASYSGNYHRFFSKDYLLNQNTSNLDAEHVLNIALMDGRLGKKVTRGKPPSKYMKKFKDNNPEFETSMMTHLVDPDESGIWSDDYDTFIDMRAKAVRAKIVARLIPRTFGQQLDDLSVDDSDE